jgi:hypothetical protein
MPSTNLPASIASGFLIVAMSLLAVEPVRCHSQQPANASTAATARAENPLAVEFQACDADGALTEAEYLKRVGREMPVLRREFKVFDIDSDGRMSLAAFATSNHRTDPVTTFLHLDADLNGRLTPDELETLTADQVVIAIPDYPQMYSPEISPDGKWIAVDGWKHGQNNLAAHLLVASLETDEVRDLGIGCIPHWSADSRRIAYSKYGQGVFIRDFEEPKSLKSTRTETNPPSAFRSSPRTATTSASAGPAMERRLCT